MSLIKCKECGKEISNKADVCPHCGAKPYKASGCFVVVLAALAIFGTIGVMSSKGSPPPTPPAPIATKAESSPEPPSPALTQARAKTHEMPYEKFCLALGKTVRATAKKPNELREAMIERAMSKGATRDMIAGIELRAPVFGMDLCVVLATFGYPDRTNRSVSPGGEHMQLVYDQRQMYIYLDNNKVTHWQD
ncbi:MAG: zinc ribbon domain-containing protein [Rhodocyclales bacterium]|nr:zinc ribbon domain-containing protein [Rhodocyclales bacterium]